MKLGQNDCLVDREGATPITVKPGHAMLGSKQYLIPTGGECQAIPSPNTSQRRTLFPPTPPSSPSQECAHALAGGLITCDLIGRTEAVHSCKYFEEPQGLLSTRSLPVIPALSTVPSKPSFHENILGFFSLLLLVHKLPYLACLPGHHLTGLASRRPVHPQSLDLNAPHP